MICFIQIVFTIGESRSISQETERERQGQERPIQQVAGNPRRGRFTTETIL